MKIHLEGMGWFGSILAFRLARAGIPFTWHDTDVWHTAWKASTGLVYPAGDARSVADLDAWGRWHSERLLPAGTVEPVSYCYAHKHPPHGGVYPFTPLGVATYAAAPAYAVNVPGVVAAARRGFAELRQDGAPRPGPTEVVVRAHGGHRSVAYFWGWSAPVHIPAVAPLDGLPHRPAYYARRVRRLVYAYPIPGRPEWYWAGSTLVRQTRPRPLDADKHFARWAADWAAVFPRVPIVTAEAPTQGWRPCPADGDPGGVTADRWEITFPALWHSGVRWAPTVLDEAMGHLGAQGVRGQEATRATEPARR